MELTLHKESVVVEELKAVEIMRSRLAQFIYDRNYNRIGLSHGVIRLQSSPYFCVFKYARAVKQKVWNEAENSERDWGEMLKIRFFPLASKARALRARKTLTPQFTFFFY